ncbi:hypothetical protein TWF132_004305 [Orbilia oligospora]|nr:hypothetical protein TWF132_004305 [Orbilia oligospora]
METPCHDPNPGPASDFSPNAFLDIDRSHCQLDFHFDSIYNDDFLGSWPSDAADPQFGYETAADLDLMTWSLSTTQTSAAQDPCLVQIDSAPSISFTSPNPNPLTPIDEEKDSEGYTAALSISSGISNKEKSPSLEPSRKRPKSPKWSTRKISLSCPECTMSCASRKALGQHIYNVHKIKAFKCEYCPYRCRRSDNLRTHEKSCKAYSNRSGRGKPVETKEYLSTLGKRAKLQRVNILNLHKASPRLLHSIVPGPTYSTTNGCKLEIPSISYTDLQFHGKPNSPKPSVPSPDHCNLEIAALRKRLEEAEEETRVWKQSYLELRFLYR